MNFLKAIASGAVHRTGILPPWKRKRCVKNLIIIKYYIRVSIACLDKFREPYSLAKMILYSVKTEKSADLH